MTRKFEGGKLVLATHNKGKLAEFRHMLGDVDVTSAGELNVAEPAETGTTFFDNCMIKAKAVSEATGLPCLADDSGLCVTALDGAPGVYSADWAGPEKDFAGAMEEVHFKMGDTADRSAAFVSTLILMWPDGHYETAEGRVEGRLVWPPRGDNGFGYDPMFIPVGETRTFGEMSMEEKKAFSHRAIAFEVLRSAVL